MYSVDSVRSVYECCFLVCVLTFQKSHGENVNNEWQVSNTMSREANENHAPARYPDTIDIDNNQVVGMTSLFFIIS